MFITFEGSEGCGKSTQIKLFSDYLNSKNIKNVITREPGGTKLAEKIREIVKYCDYEEISPISEILLFSAARSQHFNNFIKPHLDNDYTVLCDRYIDSTFVYQGLCKFNNISNIEKILSMISLKIYPDLTFYIDIPVEESIKRINNRSLKNMDKDRFETRGNKFLEEVRNGFLYLSRNFSKRIKLINGCDTIENVQKQIEYIFKQTNI